MRKFSYNYIQPAQAEGEQNIPSIGVLNLDAIVDSKFIFFTEEGVNSTHIIVYLDGIGANKLMDFALPLKEGQDQSFETHLAEVPNSIYLSHPRDVMRYAEAMLLDHTKPAPKYSKKTKSFGEDKRITPEYTTLMNWLNSPAQQTDVENIPGSSEEE